MVGFQEIRKALESARFVSMERYHPCSEFEQKAKFAKKSRVTMPTGCITRTKDKFDKASYGMDEMEIDAFNSAVDWKCSGLGSQPVIDLPSDLRTILKSNDFYTTKYTGNSGVWYSILFGLDPNFITRTMSNQQKCIMELKQQMGIELDTYYAEYKYRQFGYVKSDMHRVLLQSDEYHTHLGHYITDFLKINIMVLMPNNRYYWLGRYNEKRISFLLQNRGAEWGSIVHTDQKSHLFTPEQIEEITSNLKHMDEFDVSKQNQNLTMDSGTLLKLKRAIKNMKIRELQDRALELELLIVDENGKKKLKSNLQEEVYIQLTGCESFS